MSGQLKTPNLAHNRTLSHRIAQRIREHSQQRVSFTDYMNWALYDPDDGYYAINAVQIGVKGDFFTSPHLGPDFGELLAEQFLQMWQLLGTPAPFTLVEMGAGQGLIAADILRYLQRRAPTELIYAQFQAALDYIIVEKAAALIAEQKHHLQPLSGGIKQLRWLALEDIPPKSLTGCLFSNELVDALPVHQVTVQSGALREVYVKNIAGDFDTQLNSGGRLFEEECDRPSTPQLTAYLESMGIDLQTLPEGYCSEINLAALDWLSAAAQTLQRGYLLTIDYGYSAQQYYSPARGQGTLQCYRHHAQHSDPYLCVGQQDITSHVNFTALEQHGRILGLKTLGRTQQGLFLMALGLGDRLVANNNTADLAQLSDVLRRRDAIHSLINPMGLGGFQVLIQGKGLEDTAQVLLGLQSTGF